MDDRPASRIILWMTDLQAVLFFANNQMYYLYFPERLSESRRLADYYLLSLYDFAIVNWHTVCATNVALYVLFVQFVELNVSTVL